MKRRALLLGIALAACSGEDLKPEPRPSLVQTIDAAPASAAFSIEASIDVDGSITAVGAATGGQPIVVANERVFALESGALVWRPLYAEESDPRSIGSVGAIVPRIAGGAWLAGDDRLFIVDQLYLLSSPLALDAGVIHAIEDVQSGPMAGLWIGTETGLFRRTNDELSTWVVPNASGAVTGIAIERNGRFGLAIVGSTLITLETAGADVVTDRGVVDIGEVRAVASAQGAVWAAGSKGVVRFAASESPPYRHYTLAGGDVHALATDPVTGHAWARTSASLVQIDGTTVQSYDAPMIANRSPDLAIDMLGDVFTAGETTLEKSGTGATGGGISFVTDVQPWIQMHCSQCHMNQTQNFEDIVVFREQAEDALSRVRTGDMPRCAGGVRCETGLAPADYAVLEKWLRDGMIE